LVEMGSHELFAQAGLQPHGNSSDFLTSSSE
jgi:hypothetical protein